MMLNAIKIVVIKSTNKPNRNKISAKFSSLVDSIFLLRMARNDSIQLIIKITIANEALSSIREDSWSFEIFTEVITIKQNPNKLADVFKI